MRFSVWVSTGWPWNDILEFAHHVEAAGWDGIWVPDHFMPPEGGYGNEPKPGDDPELAPVHEAWTTIAALASIIPRLTLGVLVSGNTYRYPAVVTKMASTIDHVSGGRFILGLGAGWQENEHQRYGIAYPDPAQRSDRLEEAAAVISTLFGAERSSFHGAHYTLDEAPLEPKPVQSPMPLLIGGGGERRTIRTAARYASSWNTWGTPKTMRHKIEILAEHCRDVGRDPGELTVSANALLDVLDGPPAESREMMGERGGLVGTPDHIRAQVAAYAEAGVDEIVVAGFNHDAVDFPLVLDRLREVLCP